MNRIEELLDRLSPEGVQMKTLGNVGEFIRGNGLQKSDLTDRGTPAIHYGQIHTHYGIWADSTKSFTDPKIAAKLRRAKPGDLIIATTSEDDAAVAKATAWVGTIEVAVSGDAYIYRHSLDPRYVAYFFTSGQFQSQKTRHISGTKVRRVSGSSLAKIRLPVPPMEVQREIVRVLDQFSRLEAELAVELKAELNARRHQYEHYRDSLMAFTECGEIRWVPMGDIGEFIRGRRFTKNDFVDVGVPSIHYGEIYTVYGTAATSTVTQVREEMVPQLRFARPGDVIIAAVGETVEDVGKAVAWLGSGDVAIHDDCFLYRHSLDPKFVSYFLQSDAFHSQKGRHVSRAKVKRLSREGLSRITIPVPPIEEQRRIAAILEQFDALVNDLGIGLPAELTARRKQYEYYRDGLLTFEEQAG